MNRFKVVTHIAALVFATITGFAITPAGQALVRQYPRLSGVFALVTALGALYHTPRSTD